MYEEASSFISLPIIERVNAHTLTLKNISYTIIRSYNISNLLEIDLCSLYVYFSIAVKKLTRRQEEINCYPN